MGSEEFREIMEAIKDLSVNQGILKERVETHLKDSEKRNNELSAVSKTVYRHDLFMKSSLWVYGLLGSMFGYRLFKS